MWQSYQKIQTTEMRPYIEGEDMSEVSVSDIDTPEVGGMIARNTFNYSDQRYVAKLYFKNNYEATSYKVKPDKKTKK